MVSEEIRKQIADAGYESSLLYDNPSFDNSIIGIDEDGKVVYDYNLMAEEFVNDEGKECIEKYRETLPEGTVMSDDEIYSELLTEAFEFIDYNTLRATTYGGSLAPIVICNMEYMGDEYEGGTKFQNMINSEPYDREIVFKIKEEKINTIMGYQITFKPTPEKMEEYKKAKKISFWGSNEDLIASYKREIVDFCLKDAYDEECKKFKDVEFFLTTRLNMLADVVRNEERENAYDRWENDENKELWFCGWEFSHDSEITKDELLSNTLDKLCILKNVVKTPSYFEESERFYDKWNEIKEEVNGFIECLSDVYIHEIIDELREFEVKYDDEDDENAVSSDDRVEIDPNPMNPDNADVAFH